MRQAMNLNGLYGKGAVAARDAYMRRFYPEIDDNDWSVQSQEIALQTNFAEYSMTRRLTLIRQQEEAEGSETSCPLFTWAWSDAHSHTSKQARQFFRGPYDPDNAITSRGEAGLLMIMGIANALRCMDSGDQNRFVLNANDFAVN